DRPRRVAPRLEQARSGGEPVVVATCAARRGGGCRRLRISARTCRVLRWSTVAATHTRAAAGTGRDRRVASRLRCDELRCLALGRLPGPRPRSAGLVGTLAHPVFVVDLGECLATLDEWVSTVGLAAAHARRD